MCMSGVPHHTKCLPLFFLTYKHVLNILQIVSFGTLLSYPSLALGVGYLYVSVWVPHHTKCLSLVVFDIYTCTKHFAGNFIRYLFELP